MTDIEWKEFKWWPKLYTLGRQKQVLLNRRAKQVLNDFKKLLESKKER